jgi:hypothetical protein
MDKEIETTINRLLADKKMAVDLADYLIKENVKLREALRPFAERASAYDPDDEDNDDYNCDWFSGGTRIRIGDFRRARAALKEDK